ncbi:unnamed protein product [Echinostoma caproni]|uniref:GOLGA2L5 domain-containing protein n=1 Tax=Echinostoma caproni TaxID=27848 RepID=A0A183AF95_9TREM|nr:unnamed protein product [Echinostoma caproni]
MGISYDCLSIQVQSGLTYSSANSNNNSHQGRARTSSINSVNSQLSCSASVDADASNSNVSIVVAPERGAAIYSASGSFRVADESYKDSDAASITSSIFHSEAQSIDIQSRFQQLHRLARGYKEKNKQRERDQMKEQIETNQIKSMRRIDELQDQLELDKKAKQDVEVNYTLMLSEKDELIRVLRQQVTLLKEGKDLPEELKAVIEAGHAREEERKRSIAVQNQELKNKVSDLETQLQLTTVQLEEHVVKQNELRQCVLNCEKLKAQATKDASDITELRRQLTDTKLANTALEEQVHGLKERLTSMVNSTPAAASPVRTAEKSEDAAQSIADQLNDLRTMLETEQAARNKVEEELVHERQDAQDKLSLIEQLRLTINQCAVRTSDESTELKRIKEALEERERIFAELSATLERERDEQKKLASSLAEAERRVVDLSEKAELVSDLQNRVNELAIVEQECETLRQNVVEMEQLEVYLQNQVSRLKQVAVGVFPPDGSDPDVVTSSTSVVLDSTQDTTEPGVISLRQGIEQLISLVDRFECELAQRDKREIAEHQRETELALTISQIEETHLLQKRELEDQYKWEKSVLEDEIRQKTEQIQQLQTQLDQLRSDSEQVRVQLVTLQARLDEAGRHDQKEQETANRLMEVQTELEHQVSKWKAQCEELEIKHEQLTLNHSHLETNRNQLAERLAQTVTQVEQLKAELAAAQQTNADNKDSHRTTTLPQLFHLKQSVQSVKQVVDDLRAEYTGFRQATLNQAALETQRIVDKVQSSWSALLDSSKSTSQSSDENQRLQNETAILRERLVTLELDRERTNTQYMLLKEQAEQTTEEMERLRNDYMQLTESHQSTNGELATAHAELSRLSQTLQIERDQFSRDRDEFERSASAQQTQLAEVGKRVEELEQDRASQTVLSEQLSSEQARVKQLESELISACLNAESAHQALLELEARVGIMLDQRTADEEKWDHLNDEIQEITQRLTTSESHVQRLMGEESARLSEHQARFDAAKQEVSRLQASSNQITTELLEQQAVTKTVSNHLLNLIHANALECVTRMERASTRLQSAAAPSDSPEFEQLLAVKQCASEIIQEIKCLSTNEQLLPVTENSPLSVLLDRFEKELHNVSELEMRVEQLVKEADQQQIRSTEQAQLEISRLSERCNRSNEIEQELQKRVSQLTAELDLLRNAEQNKDDALASVESKLEATRQRLCDAEKQLQETQAVREQNEGRLEETATQLAQLEAKLVEMCNVKESISAELAAKQSELDTVVAARTEEVEQLRLEYERKLDGQLHEANEEQVKVNQSHETQLKTMQETMKNKEKQWKQQVKDLKTRLKQVLQESETLRKASVASASKEQEVFAQLHETEVQLSQKQSDCDQLKQKVQDLENRAAELEKTLEKVQTEAQSHAPTMIDDVREQYQKETEALKAEHALHTQDMQAEYQFQLREREMELRTQFEQQMADAADESERAKSKLLEERDQLKKAVDTAKQEIDALQARITSLESSINTSTAENQHPDAVSESVSGDDAAELLRLRDQVAELTARLEAQSNSSDHPRASSRTSFGDRFSEGLTVQTEHITPTEAGVRLAVHPPVAHEPIVPAKSSSWVEQLRNQILQAESIDSL